MGNGPAVTVVADNGMRAGFLYTRKRLKTEHCAAAAGTFGSGTALPEAFSLARSFRNRRRGKPHLTAPAPCGDGSRYAEEAESSVVRRGAPSWQALRHTIRPAPSRRIQHVFCPAPGHAEGKDAIKYLGCAPCSRKCMVDTPWKKKDCDALVRFLTERDVHRRSVHIMKRGCTSSHIPLARNAAALLRTDRLHVRKGREAPAPGRIQLFGAVLDAINEFHLSAGCFVCKRTANVNKVCAALHMLSKNA